MSKLSGLPTKDRIRARDMACQAAALMLHHAPCAYTEGGPRWEGIDRHLKAWRGQFPTLSDCSSSATWWIWNGLDHFHVGDVVNGARWLEGYTGTMLDHGESVRARNALRADCVIYGDRYPGFHTAMIVGRRRGDGKLMVVSHGNGSGPQFLAYVQMGQNILDIRRYI